MMRSFFIVVIVMTTVASAARADVWKDPTDPTIIHISGKIDWVTITNFLNLRTSLLNRKDLPSRWPVRAASLS